MMVRARWTGVDAGGRPSSIEEIIERARLRLPPHLWDHAVADAGTSALTHLLELLREEVSCTLPQLGVDSIRDLTSDHVLLPAGRAGGRR